MSEHQLQSAAIKFLDLSRYKNCYFAIPNGAKRSITGAQYMIQEGLRKGVPDLFIAHPSTKYHGLFVEFKSETGRISIYQKNWHEILKSKGYCVAIVRDMDEFLRVIGDYGKTI